MAHLPETPMWETGVYQIELTDPVLGGPNGTTNMPLRHLANRTSYLKSAVDKLIAGATETTKGAVALASPLEVADGQQHDRAITPKGAAQTYLKHTGGQLSGALYGKTGAATAFNSQNAGFAFSGDNDTGLFNPADGILQLASNGIVFCENVASGAVKFYKGLRVPKGAPKANDISLIGYAFADDGDTGLFAEEGTAINTSQLVLRIDSAEVARFTPYSSSLTTPGWCRLQNGLILQWGVVSLVMETHLRARGTTQVALPTSFPQGALVAFASTSEDILDAAEEFENSATCKIVNNSTIKINAFRVTGSNPSGIEKLIVHYLVLGH